MFFNEYFVICRQALVIIDKIFEEIVEDQQFFSTPDGLAKLLKTIPDDGLASLVKKTLEDMPPNSLVRWKTFVQVCNAYSKEVSSY